MNRLSPAERARIVRILLNGNGVRGCARIVDHSLNTVLKLIRDLGGILGEFQYEAIRNLPTTRIECDEIKTFVRARSPRLNAIHRGIPGYGDVWVWVAFDPDSKLVCTWMVGLRGANDARLFTNDLASRLTNRIQLTTDGWTPYVDAVEEAFGGDIDYAVSMKKYGWGHKLSPRNGVILSETIVVVSGDPDIDKVSTAGVERQNLTMRTSMRRFMRMTNGHSKKPEYLAAMLALHYMYYNFARPHKSLANPYPRTPAMAAGLADHVWTVEDMVALLVVSESRPPRELVAA